MQAGPFMPEPDHACAADTKSVRRFAVALGKVGWACFWRRFILPFGEMRQNALLRSGSRRPSRGRTMGIARPRWMSPRRAAALVAMVIAASVTLLTALSDTFVDWAWFSAVGYLDLFWIVL